VRWPSPKILYYKKGDIVAEKQRAMTKQDRELLQWVLEMGTILEEIEETAQAEAEQTERRAEIEVQLQDLDLKQLLSVARFVGVTEAEIAEDLALATTTAV
jgi:allophanate hydrolase subunit 1